MDFELKQIKTSLPFSGFIESRRGGRPENQDSCGFVDTLLGLLVVVCDGMGGGPGGKTASTVAVDVIVKTVLSATADSDPIKTLQAAVKNAHGKLLALQNEKPSLQGMGTTVTILLINKHSARIAHVGDSRVYQLRWGRKLFRTEDHSLVGELVRKKALTEDAARLSPNANIINRALGVGAAVEADIAECAYEKGDRFVLCTDGVWGAMKEKDLIGILARTKTLSGAMEKAMVKVDEIGMDEGGMHDNFTMALLETTCNSTLKETMTTKTRNALFGLSVLCGLSLIGNGIQFAVGTGGMSNNYKVMPADSSALTIHELKQQMAEKELWMNEMEEQIQMLQQKNDDTFDKLEKIENSSKEVAKIVKENKKAKVEVTEHLEKELDKLIAQLEDICEMSKGSKKDKKIAEAKKNIKGLSRELISYGIRSSQLNDLLTLLSNSIAKSDKKDEKYKKDEQYMGHWTGTKPKGIITLMKDIKKQVSKH